MYRLDFVLQIYHRLALLKANHNPSILRFPRARYFFQSLTDIEYASPMLMVRRSLAKPSTPIPGF